MYKELVLYNLSMKNTLIFHTFLIEIPKCISGIPGCGFNSQSMSTIPSMTQLRHLTTLLALYRIQSALCEYLQFTKEANVYRAIGTSGKCTAAVYRAIGTSGNAQLSVDTNNGEESVMAPRDYFPIQSVDHDTIGELGLLMDLRIDKFRV